MMLSKRNEKLAKEYERLKKLLQEEMNKEKNGEFKTVEELLAYIQEVEDLHGTTLKEENRRLLLEYFNDFTFNDDRSMKALIYTFLGKEPLFPWELINMERLISVFNKEYEFHASVNGLHLTIVDEVIEKYRTQEEIDKLFNGEIQEKHDTLQELYSWDITKKH